MWTVTAMNSLYIGAGLVLLIVLCLDSLWTTMGEGGGFLTRRMGGFLWNASLCFNRVLKSHGFLAAAGVLIIILTVLAWILILWAGWTAIFSAAPTALEQSQTGIPATAGQRAYFVGYTIFTLGLGDFRPEGIVWQLLTPIASFSGLFVTTLSITYLVPVVQAATEKRTLSVYLSSLGTSPEAILLNAWNGHNFDELMERFGFLSTQIAKLEQQHHAYPVLHYIHSLREDESISIMLSRLDEALTLLIAGIAPSVYREKSTASVRFLIGNYIAYLERNQIKSLEEEAGGLGDMDRLRQAGIPTLANNRYQKNITGHEERRRLLRAMVANKGWSWRSVYGADSTPQPERR